MEIKRVRVLMCERIYVKRGDEASERETLINEFELVWDVLHTYACVHILNV